MVAVSLLRCCLMKCGFVVSNLKSTVHHGPLLNDLSDTTVHYRPYQNDPWPNQGHHSQQPKTHDPLLNDPSLWCQDLDWIWVLSEYTLRIAKSKWFLSCHFIRCYGGQQDSMYIVTVVPAILLSVSRPHWVHQLVFPSFSDWKALR